MKIVVKEVAESRKNISGDVYWPIKAEDGKTYNLDKQAAVGATLEVDVRESSYTDKRGKQQTGRWATVKGTVSSDQGATNGRQAMNQFIFGEAIEFYWDKLKPFEMTDVAKASVLCTCLIATADGRVPFDLPPDQPEPFEE